MHRLWQFRWASEVVRQLGRAACGCRSGTAFAVAEGMEKPTTPAPVNPHYAQPREPHEGAPTPKQRPRPNPDEERSLPFLPIG
jgi:hypothetical protein